VPLRFYKYQGAPQFTKPDQLQTNWDTIACGTVCDNLRCNPALERASGPVLATRLRHIFRTHYPAN